MKQTLTGNLDQRNVLAHLHFVTDEDISRVQSLCPVTEIHGAKPVATYFERKKVFGM